MNPLVWFVAGMASLFFMKKAKAANVLDVPGHPPPLPVEVVVVPIPAGWRRVTTAEVTPALQTAARDILAAHGGNAYGTLIPFGGGQYAGLIEQHYHEPGGPVKPWGFHHGVTLLTRIV